MFKLVNLLSNLYNIYILVLENHRIIFGGVLGFWGFGVLGFRIKNKT